MRTFLALLIIPLFTLLPEVLGAALAGESSYESNPWYVRVAFRLFLPLWGASLAWSAYLLFLAIGVPTVYVLYRANQTDFGAFAIFGALYTPLSCLLVNRVHPFHWISALQQFRAIPVYAVIGAVSGILTRLIVLGRQKHGSVQSPAS